MSTYLQGPWGVEGRDELLANRIEDEDWASIVIILRDDVRPETMDWKRLALFAHALFHDAAMVMTDELPDACREALGLLELAMDRGAPLEAIEALREQVEDTLDAISRADEKLRAKLGPGDDPAALSNDELENLAHLLDRSEPLRAVKLFEALAERHADSPLRHAFDARAALSMLHAGEEKRALPDLEEAMTFDWTRKPLDTERLTLEAVETELLLRAPRAEWDALWTLATERGRVLDFPFPSAWPHQDKLFERAAELGDLPRARQLARRIEEEREVLPQRLQKAFTRLRNLPQ